MRPEHVVVLRARARRRRAARARAATSLLLVLGAIGAGGAVESIDTYTYYNSDLPDPSSLNPQDLSQATQVLDRHGRLMYIKHGDQIRTVIPLSRVAPVLRQATVDLEDRNFYSHHGLDIPRLLGAAYADLTRTGIQQGASTITQQLVKSKYTGGQRTIDRKIREALLADQIENRYSKDQILEAYLNEIFYGHESYGIEAASNLYFGKHAADLNLAEASLLAGIPQAPSDFDPLTPEGLALCRQRQHDVLDAMVRQGDISAASQAAVEKAPVPLNIQKPDQVFLAPHFVTYVLDYLHRRYGKSLVDGGGLKVTTSLDLDLQAQAEEIVRKRVAQYGSQGVNNGALLALNPNTGEILAYVGSADFYNKSIDGAFDNVDGGGDPAYVGRQPGSSFKPYVYITALADGYAPGTRMIDIQGKYGNFEFKDFDLASTGSITIRDALVGSRNIPPIQILQELGYSRVFQTAHTLGISTNLKPELGSAIGSSEVRMLEHAAAYGAFATEGVYRPPTPLVKVEDPSGRVLYQLQPGGKRVFSQQVTYLLDDILLGYGKKWGLNLVGPAAGKSGTTNEGADLWYMGYTPDLVVGTWMARTGRNPDGSPIGLYPLKGLFGVTTSAHMFEDFMAVFYKGRSVPTFVRPPGIVSTPAGCHPTPGGGNPENNPLVSPPGTEPAMICSFTDIHVAGTEGSFPVQVPNPAPTAPPVPPPTPAP